MNTVRSLRWIVLLSLPTATFAQEAPVRMLGQSWVGADGNQREAQIGFLIDRPRQPSPTMVRLMEVNWRASPYQKGPFPAPVGEDDVQAELTVRLDVDDTGVPRNCAVTKPNGNAAFDGHACPHLLRHLRFFPALNRDGKRMGGPLDLSVRYKAGRVRMQSYGGTVPMLSRPTPKPLKPIDAAAIGFLPTDGLPADVGGTSGSVRVEVDGSVSACTLAAPTQNDRFDIAICERLRAWPFQPAVDRAGTIVAADYSFGVSRR